ncbi:hypothetical protein DL768_004984 [Monosporascus sp. mg162]|nr:hypothetical protein DL768_004984 [Monosporascus sp. mg162]
MNVTLDHYNDVMIMRDTQTEKAVDLTHEGMTVRVAVLKDLFSSDAAPYSNPERAKITEMKTEAATARIEPEMGRSVENFMLGHDHKGRNRLREAAKSPKPGTQATIETIIKEDRSHSRDSFYQYHRDSAAAEEIDPVVYERIAKDEFVPFDREGNLVFVLCIRTIPASLWGHMVYELMRRQHPELDMELATTPKQLKERVMCIVHYGTWAEQGLTRRQSRAELLEEVFPHFKVAVLGLSSEVARFLMRHLAPKEYQDCLETFRGLPKQKRIAVSRPSWVTLFVLGINSFLQRHNDQNDIKNGLVGLISMGNYTGMSALTQPSEGKAWLTGAQWEVPCSSPS